MRYFVTINLLIFRDKLMKYHDYTLADYIQSINSIIKQDDFKTDFNDKIDSETIILEKYAYPNVTLLMKDTFAEGVDSYYILDGLTDFLIYFANENLYKTSFFALSRHKLYITINNMLAEDDIKYHEE